MKQCPQCPKAFEPTSSPFRLCPACRRSLPPRQVNTEPLDRVFKKHLDLEKEQLCHHNYQAYLGWKKQNPRVAVTYRQFIRRS